MGVTEMGVGAAAESDIVRIMADGVADTGNNDEGEVEDELGTVCSGRVPQSLSSVSASGACVASFVVGEKLSCELCGDSSCTLNRSTSLAIVTE